MTDTLSILGQAIPSANTITTLYTVPAATSTTVSSLTVCNQSASSCTFNISVAVAGAADTPKQYIYYELFLDGNDTFIATIGISMATTDVMRCFSTNASTSFNLFGVQIT